MKYLDDIDDVNGMKTKLRIARIRIDNEMKNIEKYKLLYEREVAWANYLYDDRERFIKYVRSVGHLDFCDLKKSSPDESDICNCTCGYDELFKTIKRQPSER